MLSADALADLLQMAQAKLVVIGSCDSIALGATLVNVCHVIAARDMVSPKMMAAWVEAFYAKLPQRSLSEALDYALKISRAPMRFYGRQVANVDLLFMPRPPRRLLFPPETQDRCCEIRSSISDRALPPITTLCVKQLAPRLFATAIIASSDERCLVGPSR